VIKMKTAAILCALALFLAPAVTARAETGAGEVLGTVEALSGEVKVGAGGAWSPAAAGQELREGQVIRTGAASEADILFGGKIGAVVGPEVEIKVSDLLLRTRLEQMRSKISPPVDTRKVEMQVTPTTGVRGTEQTPEKAEELKREHYWNEDVKKAE
jgi:hypothetical protein